MSVEIYPTSDTRDAIFSSINDDERAQQKTPLCQTPTSQLLQLAAQFLPTPPSTPSEDMNPKTKDLETDASKTNPSDDIFDLLKQGWWRASPSQLQEVSESIKNSGIVEKMAQIKIDSTTRNTASTTALAENTSDNHGKTEHSDVKDAYQKQDKNNNDRTRHVGSDYKVAINSLSATISYLKEQNKEQERKEMENATGNAADNLVDTSKSVAAEDPTPIARCPRPLQPGSYWYSKQFQSKGSNVQELPSNSSDEVRKVLATLTCPKQKQAIGTEYDSDDNQSKLEENLKLLLENSPTPHASIDMSESFSAGTITLEGSAENLVKEVDSLNVPSKPTVHEEVDKIISDVHKFDDVFEIEVSETEQFVRDNINQAMKIRDSGKHRSHFEHNFESCVATDCMCYEAVFRQDHPIETSSMKSDSSFTESLELSPKKSVTGILRQQKLSSSSVSDESTNSSINRRRSRIAAKFEQPME